MKHIILTLVIVAQLPFLLGIEALSGEGTPVANDVPVTASMPTPPSPTQEPSQPATEAAWPPLPMAKDVHPKLESSLSDLEKEYLTGIAYREGFAAQFKFDDQDRVEVAIHFRNAQAVDVESLETYGAKIVQKVDNIVVATIPIFRLSAIANSIGGITYIRRPDEPVRRPAFYSSPQAATSDPDVVRLVGAHRYHSAGYQGQGVKVAVVDGGFGGLRRAIAAGEVPHTALQIDCTGEACQSPFSEKEEEEGYFHGTLMATIIYDMAPEAEIYLIKAQKPSNLRLATEYCIGNGIRVISVSMGFHALNFYSGECYESGTASNPVCSADKARKHDILWVNSVGDYYDSHMGFIWTDLDNDRLMEFRSRKDDEGMLQPNKLDKAELIKISALGNLEEQRELKITLYLTWKDWPYSSNNYDMFLFDSNNRPLATEQGRNMQNGSQAPREVIGTIIKAPAEYLLVVVRRTALPTSGSQIYHSYELILDGLSGEVTMDPSSRRTSIDTPADAKSVMAAGAISYERWQTGPEWKNSAWGPTNDGRTKPDIMAPADVWYGGKRFYGTSPATAYVAGAAVLVLSKDPHYSADQLWNKLIKSAIPIGEEVPNNRYGYGRLNIGLFP